jgi:hypothetical protein
MNPNDIECNIDQQSKLPLQRELCFTGMLIFLEFYLQGEPTLQSPQTVFHCDNLVNAMFGLAWAVAVVIGR